MRIESVGSRLDRRADTFGAPRQGASGLEVLEPAAKELGVYLVLDALRHERARTSNRSYY
jgi:hypothetical protein